MTTVIVAGALANKPGNGGEAWVRLTWALGLRALGFDVHLIEQIDQARCIDVAGNPSRFRTSVNRAFFASVIAQFGLAERATLVTTDGSETLGLPWPELVALTEAADLLLNISGHLTIAPLLRGIRRKVYLDIDPGFTQFWHASGNLGAHLAGHDEYFTIGANIGTRACTIPTGEIRWHTTRPPVHLPEWPLTPVASPDRFTTVATWRGPYGPVQYGGATYGLKVHEFRKVLLLPQHAAQSFEIALNIHPADVRDRDALLAHGWHLVDPFQVAATPRTFQRYLQQSSAEFSVAQGVYVATGSGWVSDRTVHYLATGKPVLVQNTGIDCHYPTGYGLVTFRTLEEAVTGAAWIAADYEMHCHAAREIAEEYFCAPRVIGAVVTTLGFAP